MSFFEVQSCGLPVLFEENEINDLRATKQNAFTFALESVEDFRAKLVDLAARSSGEQREYSRNARNYVLENYDFVPIAQQFTDVLERAIRQWRITSKSSS